MGPARRLSVCVPVRTNLTRPGPFRGVFSLPCVPLSASVPHRPHTLNSTSTSKSFQSTVTGELSAPYSKQFVHSKSSQYRKMKTEWKSNVYLARSRIQVSGGWVPRTTRGRQGSLRGEGLCPACEMGLQAAGRDALLAGVV